MMNFLSLEDQVNGEFVVAKKRGTQPVLNATNKFQSHFNSNLSKQ